MANNAFVSFCKNNPLIITFSATTSIAAIIIFIYLVIHINSSISDQDISENKVSELYDGSKNSRVHLKKNSEKDDFISDGSKRTNQGNKNIHSKTLKEQLPRNYDSASNTFHVAIKLSPIIDEEPYNFNMAQKGEPLLQAEVEVDPDQNTGWDCLNFFSSAQPSVQQTSISSGLKIDNEAHKYLFIIDNSTYELRIGKIKIPEGIDFPNGIYSEIEVKEFLKDANGDLLAEYPLVENKTIAHFFHLNGPKLEDNKACLLISFIPKIK